jgi:hypothetical protein
MLERVVLAAEVQMRPAGVGRSSVPDGGAMGEGREHRRE